jgi:uncharacterized membrane protein
MYKALPEEEDEAVSISSRLFGFLFLGIALVFVGVVVLLVASLLSGGSTSTGVVILIGPVPIVLGSGPNAVWLVLIGVILSILSVVLFWLMNRRTRKFS